MRLDRAIDAVMPRIRITELPWEVNSRTGFLPAAASTALASPDCMNLPTPEASNAREERGNDAKQVSFPLQHSAKRRVVVPPPDRTSTPADGGQACAAKIRS